MASKRAATPLPKLPLDGIDIWPLLSGQRASLEREALLYFDGWNLQCARLGKWKLHFARYNSMVYTPAPSSGRLNLPLKSPELYDIENDADESYDAAAENPTVVAEILQHVERLLQTFPVEVKKAWEETQGRKVQDTPAGALPILRP